MTFIGNDEHTSVKRRMEPLGECWCTESERLSENAACRKVLRLFQCCIVDRVLTRAHVTRFLQKGFIHRIACLNNRGIKSQECISINSLIFREKRAPKPRYVLLHAFLRTLCCGSL